MLSQRQRTMVENAVRASLKDAEDRVRWLEDLMNRELGVDCHRLPTGTPVSFLARGEVTPQPTAAQCAPPTAAQADAGDASTIEANPDAHDETPHAEGSNMSMLALNATGEQRYLGPSSGSFFASYAAAILQSCAPGQPHIYSEQPGIRSATEISRGVIEQQLPLQPSMVNVLQKSYEMWINPLYPLISLRNLNELVTRCAKLQAKHPEFSPAPTENISEMTIFYLVMALGAMNRARTLSQLPPSARSESTSQTAATPSPTMLYSLAMHRFQSLSANLQANVPVIQVLLLVCIYSSQSPLGPSQWQLAGFAMRSAVEIGLHHSSTGCGASEDDAESRNRVFWTAYAIEITISYNLGRPPSISDEHITADYPTCSVETALAIQHIEHRRIQGRIISQVYCGALTGGHKTAEEQQQLIARLQTELDDWKVGVNALCPSSDESPYPQSYWNRLYHGTSFVLHRKSPLCPAPSKTSLERCIRAAGGYVDDVYDLLKNSDVPTTWMLAQGVLFAGLTMLVTSRTSFRKIPRQVSLSLLLVDFPAWTRRCAVCLAIMNERWSHTLLAKLTGQFEVLADSTHRMISTALLSTSMEQSLHQAQEPSHTETQVDSIRGAEHLSFGDPSDAFQEHVPDFMDNYDSFAELFSTSGTSSFWEFPSQDMDMALCTEADFFNDDSTAHNTSTDQGNGWLMQSQ
ncbi:hypothetical protein MBLNU13_g00523t1 [Cladosporium sp. NU13]